VALWLIKNPAFLGKKDGDNGNIGCIIRLGIMDKNVAFLGYIASNGQKCCSFLDRYLDNTKNYLTFALSV